MRRNISLFLAAILIVGFAACEREISVTGVSLDRSALEITVGETERLIATVRPDNADNQFVRWTSSNTAVATVANGVVTAVAAGIATITVTTVDGEHTATAIVTVPAVGVTSIALDKPTVKIIVGNTETLTATVSPNNATNQNINWTSSNTAVATVNNGVITAVSAGVAIITATTTDGNLTATSDVEVFGITDAGVVINGIRWATRNVALPGTFAAAPESAGMLYQWGGNIGWTSTDPLRSSDGSQWRSRSIPQENRWLPENDPCPVGWRLPYPDEMQMLIDAGHILTTQNGIDGRLFGTAPYQIFLPLVRARTNNWTGELDDNPTLPYWSNSGFSIAGIHLRLSGMGSDGSRSGVPKNNAFALRCVTNE